MAEKSAASQHHFTSKSTADDVAAGSNLDGKVAIVTGANSGIGFVAARALAKIGAHVILACRDMTKCQQAADQIKQATGNKLVDPMQLDLSSFASIRNFTQSFKQKKLPLHYLINNAGVYGPPNPKTEDGFEVHLGTNHLGPFYLTYLLTDVLKSSAPSRIVNVGAHGHKMVSKMDWDSLNGSKSAFDGVNTSKVFTVWHAYELHRRLSKFGVSAFCIHPGLVKTEVFRNSWILGFIGWIGGQTAETGAANTVFAALHADPATQGGEYLADFKLSQKSKLSGDAAQAKRGWDESVKLCGLDPKEVDATMDK
eukprot:TRINITY_DN5994_c0_g1_i1.p1 TRINITY_DN5994_c0_g1~~TRINITY_DN5994_c0_g1_i1.p1  ORF type:complete len:349 (+),score=67.02 TRINITY_DN5994_c0_g1_i1:117-1049(+)